MLLLVNNNEVMTQLKSFCNSHPGTYCQTLFDNVQTHAIYNVFKGDKDMIKLQLKKIGAKKFRIVTSPSGKVIICFDASAIK